MRATKEQLEAIAEAIDGCLQITRSTDLMVLTQILSMARLELQLHASTVTDEEFRAYCSKLDETLDQQVSLFGEDRKANTMRTTRHPIFRFERRREN